MRLRLSLTSSSDSRLVQRSFSFCRPIIDLLHLLDFLLTASVLGDSGKDGNDQAREEGDDEGNSNIFAGVWRA